MKRKTIEAILLFFPAFLSGTLAIFTVYFSATIYHFLNPKYELPDNKSWIEVAPVSKYFWGLYIKYCRKYLPF